ncbi:GNAT family N-acetyltransferase [Microbacterium yannicii]|uniref:GNAT family N-acetyltransferase n=1 Tax=Microbacterium yannicii TaxID=671622 RepID=UPI0002FD92BE|nr:GNAT family N-acetyltransferase [Microbacterium yannicii]
MGENVELLGPHIRNYRTEDAPATLAIFLAAITETAAADYSPEQVRAWARPDRRNLTEWDLARKARNTYVALIVDEVVGFSDVSATGYIDMMFVSPAQARRGVARTLLMELERRARDTGVTRLTADVSVTARPFFERFGFHVVAEQRPVTDGVRMTNFRMAKALPHG